MIVWNHNTQMEIYLTRICYENAGFTSICLPCIIVQSLKDDNETVTTVEDGR